MENWEEKGAHINGKPQTNSMLVSSSKNVLKKISTSQKIILNMNLYFYVLQRKIKYKSS